MRVPFWTIPALLLAVIVLASSFACGGDSDGGGEPVDGVYPTATLPAELPEVFIVSGTPQPPSNNSGGTYVVQDGDTPSSIAAQFNVSLDELLSVNGITDPTSLFVGQELTIPGTGGTAEPQDDPTAAPTEPPAEEEPPPEPTSAAEDGTYIVQEGDTPETIAAQFGISAEDLMDANGITDPTSLLIGDVLTIPGQ